MKDPGRERSDVLEKLTAAIALLERSMDISLIPENGTGLAYAISGARDKNGVAAVHGGIILEKGKPHVAGPCAFGAEESIARILLTVMKFDPRIRCVATLRFSEPALRVIGSLLLECSKFDPLAEPTGISSMDWGVASCCREGVPDVCYRYRKRRKRGNYPLVCRRSSRRDEQYYYDIEPHYKYRTLRKYTWELNRLT